jgi:hypothetical protein
MNRSLEVKQKRSLGGPQLLGFHLANGVPFQ